MNQRYNDNPANLFYTITGASPENSVMGDNGDGEEFLETERFFIVFD